MANGSGNGSMANLEEGVSPLRQKIFSSEKTKRQARTVDFFDTKIEIRQPTLGSLLTAKDLGNSRDAVVRSLIDCAFDPATGQKVFQESDFEAIKDLPWSKDFENISEVLNELTGLDFKKPSSSSSETPSSSP
jgi:hypothetical protein